MFEPYPQRITVEQALAILGSADAVARYLSTSTLEVVMWLSGLEPMPTNALYKLVEVIRQGAQAEEIAAVIAPDPVQGDADNLVPDPG